MDDKDKIFLVFYVGVKHINRINITTYLNEIANHMVFDDTIKTIFICDIDSNKTRVECINPKLITEAEYCDVQELIDKSDKIIKKLKDYEQ